MNQRSGTGGCLSSEEWGRVLFEEGFAGELEVWEKHLSECSRCRGEVDAQLEGVEDWSDAREYLGELEEQGEGESSWDARSLLTPSEDPGKLGRIANYEVVGLLGRGGMGMVFKAMDPTLNRYVAIKMLLPFMASSGAARRRFAREAQAAAAVVDDHVVAIHAVDEWQGIPYIVMPYVKGHSLQKRLVEQGPLELREILRIGFQVARGLAAAHSQGLVHRDVKPGNILLLEGLERAMITDFGLARAVDDASLTRSGTLAGTPQYMSPEQANGRTVDARSDLFSLGSVLYAMCTGWPPFRAESSYGVLRLITDREPRSIREVNPDIPEWMERLVGRLMAKPREMRYESAAEVARLLEQALAHVQQPMHSALPDELLESRGKTRLERGVVGIGVALMLVAGWLIWSGWGEASWLGRIGKERVEGAIGAMSTGSASEGAEWVESEVIGAWKAREGFQGAERVRQKLRAEMDFATSGGSMKEILKELGEQLEVSIEVSQGDEAFDTGDMVVGAIEVSGSGREVLRRVLERGKLSYIVHEDSIEVAKPEWVEGHPTIRFYDMRWIARSAGEGEQIMRYLQRALRPDGGNDRFRRIDSQLIVAASEAEHIQIERLLALLEESRKARLFTTKGNER